MAKLIVEDVRPPANRSIRDVPLGAKERRSGAPRSADTRQLRRPFLGLFRRGVYLRGSRSLYGVSVVVIAVVLYFVFSAIFGGATITVTPKIAVYTLAHEFDSKKSAGTSGLAHEMLTLAKDVEERLAATGERYVESKASGRLVIFNASTVSPQRLIKNTRFETDKGLIFRISESVVVPGKTGTGENEKPGSIEVTVYADDAGTAYNIGLSDFTIPGFKSDPDKYKNIFARSKTVMTGGSVGVRKVVDESAVAEAKGRLEEKLRTELVAAARSDVPESFVLYDSMATISFENLPDSEGDGGSLVVKRRGTLAVPIFSRDALSKAIAAAVEETYDGRNIEVLELADLSITSVPWPLADVASLRFKLSGKVTLVSTFDEGSFRLAFIGKPRGAVHAIRQEYPAIQTIEAVIRPFWKRRFPGSLEDIKLVTVLPQ